MDVLSIALLILRITVGLTLASHGSQKLFGWFGGAGFKSMQVTFEKMGFKPGWLWLSFAVVGELGGGLSLALGFLTPLGAAGIVGAMAMATFKTHWKNGFFATNRGYEYPLTQMVLGIFFGLVGPGGISVDALLGISLPVVPLFLGLALVALVVVLVGIRLSASPTIRV